MKNFTKGVSYYTKGAVDITFPEDDICCYYCPIMSSEYKPDRPYCRLTGEYLLAPQHMVGERCPIRFEEEKNDG